LSSLGICLDERLRSALAPCIPPCDSSVRACLVLVNRERHQAASELMARLHAALRLRRLSHDERLSDKDLQVLLGPGAAGKAAQCVLDAMCLVQPVAVADWSLACFVARLATAPDQQRLKLYLRFARLDVPWLDRLPLLLWHRVAPCAP
jgi:hypothetical protein